MEHQMLSLNQRYREIRNGNDMGNSEYRKAYERYHSIHQFLEEKEDETGISLLEELANNCTRYVNSVISFEKMFTRRGQGLDDVRRYQEMMVNADRTKHVTHDALMAQIVIVNRYLFKTYGGEIPVGGVYSLSPVTLQNRDRDAIGDWAAYLELGLYNHRLREEEARSFETTKS